MKFTTFVLLIIFTKTICASDDSSEEQFSGKEDSMCSMCVDGATWAFMLRKERVKIMDEQNSDSYGYMDGNVSIVATNGALSFALITKPKQATIISLENGKSKTISVSSKITDVLKNGYTTDNSIVKQFIEEMSGIIKKTKLDDSKNNVSNPLKVLTDNLTKLPEPIRTTVGQIIKQYLFDRLPLINGGTTFTMHFNLFSTLRGCRDRKITSIKLESDLQTLTVTTKDKIKFTLTEQGEIVQNGKIVGILNANQQGYLPGKIPVSGKDDVSYVFIPTTHKWLQR